MISVADDAPVPEVAAAFRGVGGEVTTGTVAGTHLGILMILILMILMLMLMLLLLLLLLLILLLLLLLMLMLMLLTNL
jgi:hypothetical protein